MEVAVLLLRSHVELLPAIGSMTVAHEPDLLEDIERAVDGGRNGRWVDGATALDQLGAGNVPTRGGQDRDHRPALRRPAQSPIAQPLPHARPGFGE